CGDDLDQDAHCGDRGRGAKDAAIDTRALKETLELGYWKHAGYIIRKSTGLTRRHSRPRMLGRPVAGPAATGRTTHHSSCEVLLPLSESLAELPSRGNLLNNGSISRKESRPLENNPFIHARDRRFSSIGLPAIGRFWRPGQNRQLSFRAHCGYPQTRDCGPGRRPNTALH